MGIGCGSRAIDNKNWRGNVFPLNPILRRYLTATSVDGVHDSGKLLSIGFPLEDVYWLNVFLAEEAFRCNVS